MSARFAEIDDSIEEMGRRLAAIAQQNAHPGELVQVPGGYVNTAIDALQEHTGDGQGGAPS